MAVGSKDLSIDKLAELSNEELAEKLSESKKELFNIRFQEVTGQANAGRRRNTDCRHVLMIQIFFRLPYYRQLEKYRAYTPAAFSSSSAAKIPSAFPASGLSPVSRRRSLWTLPSMLVLLFFTTMPSSSKRLAKSHGSLPGM